MSIKKTHKWTHYKIDDSEWVDLERDGLSGGFYVIVDQIKKRLEKQVILSSLSLEDQHPGWKISILGEENFIYHPSNEQLDSKESEKKAVIYEIVVKPVLSFNWKVLPITKSFFP